MGNPLLLPYLIFGKKGNTPTRSIWYCSTMLSFTDCIANSLFLFHCLQCDYHTRLHKFQFLLAHIYLCHKDIFAWLTTPCLFQGGEGGRGIVQSSAIGFGTHSHLKKKLQLKRKKETINTLKMLIYGTFVKY